jgi:hypothetical protein
LIEQSDRIKLEPKGDRPSGATIELKTSYIKLSHHWLEKRFQLIDRFIENELLNQLIIDNDNHCLGGEGEVTSPSL